MMTRRSLLGRLAGALAGLGLLGGSSLAAATQPRPSPFDRLMAEYPERAHVWTYMRRWRKANSHVRVSTPEELFDLFREALRGHENENSVVELYWLNSRFATCDLTVMDTRCARFVAGSRVSRWFYGSTMAPARHHKLMEACFAEMRTTGLRAGNGWNMEIVLWWMD